MARADVLSTGDMAKLLGCAPRTAAKLIDSGKIPGTFRIPNSVDRRVTVKGFSDYILTLPEPDRTTLWDRLNQLRSARHEQMMIESRKRKEKVAS